ncbi:hypothetical protein [Halomonas sp. I5-271120]|uniref:hypothetical protein n=1 Tax=Halomonas sp. I5-271120 TaxID=3061632 RepID=UPI0027152FB4|nr:hypothetical protein [Halomonas sp. I5-271120]
MAYMPSQAAVRQPRQQGIYDQNVLIRVDSVDVQNQMLVGEVVPTTSSSLPQQAIKVQMDLQALSTPERDRLGQRARGSFFGGKIDQRTASHCRQNPMIVAQSARTDPNKPGILFARWLVNMGQQNRVLHGRASLITRLEHQHDGGPNIAKVKRIRMWMPSLIDLNTQRQVDGVRQRLASGARKSQLPRDTIDPESQKPIIGASMRRYAFSLVALAADGQTVLERSPVFSSYVPENGYPDYVPEQLRYVERQGETVPRPIPVDESFFDQSCQGFREYLQAQGYGQDTRVAIALACDLMPAQESGMQTQRPFTPTNGERYAKAHTFAQDGWRLAAAEDSQRESHVAVVDIIMALSPQNKSVNDYVNQAVISYPLEGSFLHHVQFQGDPLLIPDLMNDAITPEMAS